MFQTTKQISVVYINTSRQGNPDENCLAEVSIESTFTDCGLLHTYERHKWDASRKFKGHNAAVIYPVPFSKVDQWIHFLVSDLWMCRI